MTEECIIIENIKDKNQEENKMNSFMIGIVVGGGLAGLVLFFLQRTNQIKITG